MKKRICFVLESQGLNANPSYKLRCFLKNNLFVESSFKLFSFEFQENYILLFFSGTPQGNPLPMSISHTKSHGWLGAPALGVPEISVHSKGRKSLVVLYEMFVEPTVNLKKSPIITRVVLLVMGVCSTRAWTHPHSHPTVFLRGPFFCRECVPITGPSHLPHLQVRVHSVFRDYSSYWWWAS